MITHGDYVDTTDQGMKFLSRTQGYCLSTDTKPTEGVGNGSVLIEMDTSKIWFFDAAGGQWLEWNEG